MALLRRRRVVALSRTESAVQPRVASQSVVSLCLTMGQGEGCGPVYNQWNVLKELRGREGS